MCFTRFEGSTQGSKKGGCTVIKRVYTRFCLSKKECFLSCFFKNTKNLKKSIKKNYQKLSKIVKNCHLHQKFLIPRWKMLFPADTRSVTQCDNIFCRPGVYSVCTPVFFVYFIERSGRIKVCTWSKKGVHFGQFLTNFDKFWQILTNFDKFWQILTNFDKFFDKFWQILTNFWQK